MQYVDAIERGEPPARPTKILQASLASENKPQVLPAPEAPPPSLTAPAPAPAPSLAPAKPAVKAPVKGKARPKG
jgi:peptidylprolyl isomerase